MRESLRSAKATPLGSQSVRVGLAGAFAQSTTLVRDVAVARTLGMSAAGDAFAFSISVSGNVANLIAVALQNAFLPIYETTYSTRGSAAAAEIAWRVLLRGSAFTIVVAIALAMCASPLFGSLGITPAVTGPVIALSGFLLAFVALEVLRSILVFRNQLGAFSLFGCASNVLFGFGVFALLLRTASALALSISFATGTVAIAAWLWCRKLALVRSSSVRVSDELAKVSAAFPPLVAVGVISLGTTLVDQTLALRTGIGSATVLSLAQRLPVVACTLPASALGAVLVRTLSQQLSEESHHLTAIVRKAFRWSVGVGFGIAFFGLFTSPFLTKVLLGGGVVRGSDLDAVIGVQRILFLQVPFYIGATVYSKTLLVLGKNWTFAAICLFLVFLNAVLDLLLMGPFGVRGIAIATPVVQLVYCALAIVLGERSLGATRSMAK